MSLDVYLNIEEHVTIDPLIYIREEGTIKGLSEEEWKQRFPGREPLRIQQDGDTTTTVYNGNITHNLGKMARHAGLYGMLWEPEATHIETAVQLIPHLAIGLKVLESDASYFRTFNPDNGWGTYEGLISFVREYLTACRRYPNANVSVWR